jgi:V-type H+-transporting ATPase subunit F
MKKKNLKSENLLMSIIGDEETVTGFLLAGIGERNEQSKNFFVISKEEKPEIEEIFNSLKVRKDIGIILISQHIAEMIRETLDAYEEVIPTILEIPSKNFPYSVEKDSLITRASRQIFGTPIPPDVIEIFDDEEKKDDGK